MTIFFQKSRLFSDQTLGHPPSMRSLVGILVPTPMITMVSEVSPNAVNGKVIFQQFFVNFMPYSVTSSSPHIFNVCIGEIYIITFKLCFIDCALSIENHSLRTQPFRNIPLILLLLPIYLYQEVT